MVQLMCRVYKYRHVSHVCITATWKGHASISTKTYVLNYGSLLNARLCQKKELIIHISCSQNIWRRHFFPVGLKPIPAARRGIRVPGRPGRGWGAGDRRRCSAGPLSLLPARIEPRSSQHSTGTAYMCMTIHNGFIRLSNLIWRISADRLQTFSKKDPVFMLSQTFLLTLINVAVGPKGPIFFVRQVKSAWSEKFEKNLYSLRDMKWGKGMLPTRQT